MFELRDQLDSWRTTGVEIQSTVVISPDNSKKTILRFTFGFEKSQFGFKSFFKRTRIPDQFNSRDRENKWLG